MGTLKQRDIILFLLAILIILFLASLQLSSRQITKNILPKRQQVADNIDAFFISNGINFRGPFFIEPHGIRYILTEGINVLFDVKKDIVAQEQALQVILKKVKMTRRRVRLIDLMPDKPHVVFKNY